MTLRNKRFIIPFEDGQAAFAVHVSRNFDPTYVAKSLGLNTTHPTIYVTGGAGEMSSEDMRETRLVVENGLVRFAEEQGAILIDGGTEAGIPTLLGEARRKNHYNFPLIGIAPLPLVRYKGHDNPEGHPLNSAHSHFVFTTGESFGDESEMITKLTHELSGKGQKPALGILINGGKIAREEVYARTTSKDLSFPLIVLEGTGRFADILARAFYAGHTDDQDLQEIIRKGKLELVSISDGPEELRHRLKTYFDNFKPATKTQETEAVKL